MPHPNEAVLQKEASISLQGSGSLGNNLTKSICYIPTLGKTMETDTAPGCKQEWNVGSLGLGII